MIKDFIYVQTTAAKDTLKTIKHLPMLLLHFVAYYVIYTLIISLYALLPINTGIIGGIILYVIRGMIFSHLLYTLDSIINSDRIYIKHLKEGFTKYLSTSITAFFVYYLLSMVIGMMTASGYNINVAIMLQILVFVAFSAVAESIYIAGAYRYDSFFTGINVVFENPINWTLVQLGFFVVGFLLKINPDIFSAFPSVVYTGNIIYSLIHILFMSIYMLYSGNLFKIIYNSTARKREYMRR